MVSYDSSFNCWVSILNKIFRYGINVGPNIELSNIFFRLNIPSDEKPDNRYFELVKTEKFFERVETILLSSKKNRGKGSYYERMIDGNKNFNQINEIINTLQKHPQSKCATIIIIQPGDDHKKARFRSGNMPCISSIDFRIREGKLHSSIIIRTEDVFLLGYPDYYFLRKFHFRIFEKIIMKKSKALSNHLSKYKRDDLEFGLTNIFIISAFFNNKYRLQIKELVN